jgi:hypothetical protein
MVAWPSALGQNIMVARKYGRGGFSPYGQQEAEKRGSLTRYIFQSRTFGDLLPSARTHLKVSTTSQESASIWGPSVQHISLWGHCIFKSEQTGSKFEKNLRRKGVLCSHVVKTLTCSLESVKEVDMCVHICSHMGRMGRCLIHMPVSKKSASLFSEHFGFKLPPEAGS